MKNSKPTIHWRLAAAFTLLIALLAGSTALAAGGDISKLAKRLAALRSEVETLSSDVEVKKSEVASRLRSIRAQKADLEMQIQQEKMRVEQLRQKLDEHREKVEADKKLQRGLEPAVNESFSTVRQTIEGGLPFKRQDRLAELDKLQKQLSEGLISPQKATSRLWQFVEDELRLTRESGLYRQIVTVDGEEVLADVARVGMVSLYFRTEDGRVGMTRETSDGWQFQTIEADAGSKQVEKLFESFKENIRVGYFEMPNGLPAGGAK